MSPAYEVNKSIILSYACACATAGALPAVGVVGVPSIQAKQFHALAKRYGVSWNKQTWAEFAGALGTGFLVQYGLNFAVREVSKFIPAYGQTAGAVLSAAMSFAVTYGMGRAVCYFLYQKRAGASVDPAVLREIYAAAFKNGLKVAKHEQS